MRFGVVILPEHPWPRAGQIWRQAEAWGFDHAWTYDHLSWRWLREKPWFGAVPTLTAAAAVTDRIKLGTLVASPGLRHPAVLAKDLMSLDDIAGGRAICGVGAGGYDSGALASGTLSPADRMARFTEFVELTDELLRGRRVDHDGAFYRCRELALVPRCVNGPRMPIAVAATGPAGMRLAARVADIWVTTGQPNNFEPRPFEQTLPVIRTQLAALHDACAAVGRDPATLRRLLVTGVSIGGVLSSATAFDQAAGVFDSCGITDFVVHWPRPAFPFAARLDVLEEVADRALKKNVQPVNG